MVTNANALHALLNLQRALEKSFGSDWLRGSTAGMGSFPTPSIYSNKKGDDFIAIAELPGMSKDEIQIQVQDKAIRVSGRKSIAFGEEVSSIGVAVHVFGDLPQAPKKPDWDRVEQWLLQIGSRRENAAHRDVTSPQTAMSRAFKISKGDLENRASLASAEFAGQPRPSGRVS